MRVWEGVEIVEILEIWGSGEVWKVEILEIWPSKCPISVEWKFDPKPAEIWPWSKLRRAFLTDRDRWRARVSDR